MNNEIDTLLRNVNDSINKLRSIAKEQDVLELETSLKKQNEAYKKLIDIKKNIEQNSFEGALFKLQFNLVMLYLICLDYKTRFFNMDDADIPNRTDFIISLDKARTFIDNICNNDHSRNLTSSKKKQLAFLYIKLSGMYWCIRNHVQRTSCIEYAYDILDAINEIEDNDVICQILIILATSANRNGHQEKCKKFTMMVEQRLDKIKNNDLKVRLHNDLATIYVKELDTAVMHLTKALHLMEQYGTEIGKDHYTSIIYQNLGAAYNIHRDYKKSYECSTIAMKLVTFQLDSKEIIKDKKIEKLLTSQLSNVYFNLGYAQARMKNEDEAVKCFQQAHKVAMKINDQTHDKVAIEALEAIATIYANTQNLNLSKKYLERALEVLVVTVKPQNSLVEQRLANKIELVSQLTKSINGTESPEPLPIKHKQESIKGSEEKEESEEEESDESTDEVEQRITHREQVNEEDEDDDDDDDDDDDETTEDEDEEETETDIEAIKKVETKKDKLQSSSKDRFSMTKVNRSSKTTEDK